MIERFNSLVAGLFAWIFQVKLIKFNALLFIKKWKMNQYINYNV